MRKARVAHNSLHRSSMKATPEQLLKHYEKSRPTFTGKEEPMPLDELRTVEKMDLTEQKAAAFDLVSNFVQGTPFQSEIANIVRPAFPTSKAEANAMHTNPSLVHRALGNQPHLLQTVVSSPSSHHAKPHLVTTVQLQEANSILNKLVPANSAHVRKTSMSITGLYKKYCDDLDSAFPPLGEEYFRKYVHELHIRFHVEAQACALCDLWTESDCGGTLSAEVYAKCQVHRRTIELQKKSYYHWMEELRDGKFGQKMCAEVYTGALIVFDFGQLDPSTKRHKDGAMHVWLAPANGSTDLRSIPFHYIGGEASDQPASVAFAVDCIRHAAVQDDLRNLGLLVFFSDGGAKEFNSDLISCLPSLEAELEKKIHWNYWAANHGAEVSDFDQQNARRALRSALPEKKVINDTATMIEILKQKQPGAKFFDASQFRRDIAIRSLCNATGISQYHYFRVENDSIIGFQDGWTSVGRRNFSHPLKQPSQQQDLLKARHDAGLGVSFCKSCDKYYVDKHTCKRKKEEESEKVLTESKRKTDVKPDKIERPDRNLENKASLFLRKTVDVYHEDGLWYCGKVEKVNPKTCVVNFCDGEVGLRVSYRDILYCQHEPQLQIGSEQGVPDYLR